MSEQQNALVQLDDLGLAPSKYADESTFDVVSTSSGFLPRLQLFGGNSDACKEGRIPIGRWGIVRGKEVEDLTAECPFLALDWRPKALQITDEGSVISVFDAKSDEFKRIAQKSEETNSKCMFGPEYLVWCPTSSMPCFATLFMSSKTSRREAANVRALIGRPGLLKVNLIKNKKFSWHGPIVVPYSSSFSAPDLEEVKNQIEIFRNPPASEVEKAPEAAESRAR